MIRDNIIVMVHLCDFRIETWGALTELCKPDNHDWPYHTLKVKKDYPIEKGFEYKGWFIKKVPHKKICTNKN